MDPVVKWKKNYLGYALSGAEKLLAKFPDTQFLFLTLTVPAEVSGQKRVKAWFAFRERLLERNPSVLGHTMMIDFKVDEKKSINHIHYHVILAVNDEYFSRHYVTQEQYLKYWMHYLGTDTAVVDIRRFESKTPDVSKVTLVMRAIGYALKTKTTSKYISEIDRIRFCFLKGKMPIVCSKYMSPKYSLYYK